MAAITIAATALMAALPSADAANPHPDGCWVSITVKAKKAKAIYAGKAFNVTARIKNTGLTKLDDFYFQFQVPLFLIPLKTKASKPVANGGPDPLIIRRGYVFFRGMSLPPRKALKVLLTVGVKTCQPVGAVQITSLAYQLNSTGWPTCLTQVPSTKINVIKNAKIARVKAGGDGGALSCITPTPSPSGIYEPVGNGLRCLESVPVESLNSQLTPTTYSVGNCYAACGFALNTLPFYFALDGSKHCYCSKTCTIIYAPDWTVSGFFLSVG